MLDRPTRPGTLRTVATDERTRIVGPVLADAAALVAFVLLGRSSHGVNGGAGWFVAVLWPFAVGWFAAALATGLYRADPFRWARLLATSVLGVTLALVLRATFTSRGTPVTFGVVALVFLTLVTVGWRAAARLVVRRRVSAPPASASRPDGSGTGG